MQFLTQLRSRFEVALAELTDDAASLAQQIAPARDPKHGDYQANVAMPLGKKLGKPPREIAEDLIGRIKIDDICEPAEVAGPGFINLRIKNDLLTGACSKLAGDDRAGVQAVDPKTYVVDFSSPNVAKPMHVGHIRSTVIGDALARILRFLGHNVITDNHLGDWGTQFGMIIYGYKHFADQVAYEAAPVTELSRIYRLIQAVIGYQSATGKIDVARTALAEAKGQLDAAEALPADDKSRKKTLKAANRSLRSAEENLESLQGKIQAVENDAELFAAAQAHDGLQTRCQLETAKLHEGDDENVGLWNKFMPIAIEVIDKVYDLLDIRFDHTLGESFYHPMLPGIVKRLTESGMAKEDNGAICIFVDGFDAPMIIQKSDGAYLYATTDIATIDYRMQEFAPDAILYVVDHRQGEHFDKLFAAVRKCGVENVELTHVGFGTVCGPDGKPYKTRSGTVIGLEYLLNEAVDRAHQVVCDPERLEKSGMNLTDEEKKHIASVVGLGAIKYADLSHNRTSDYEFNTEKMVKLDGNTSTYIQYMFARTQSILGKSGISLDAQSAAAVELQVTEPAERALMLQLLQLEDALHQCVDGYYPNVLTNYLYALAKSFATFFDQCPVLKAEQESILRSRLALCFATGKVLKLGLSLLGIGVVDRM